MSYDICIIRSKRKTISISVNSGSITVKCPLKCTKQQIDEVIEKKRAWINKTIYKQTQIAKDFGDVIAYESVLICGRKYPLHFADSNFFNGSEIYVKNSKCVREIVEKYFADSFINLCYTISRQVNLPFNSAIVGKNKSNWGTCDNYKNLSFNFRLLMVPQDVQISVILHELCHTVHFDHSPKFKRLLRQLCPDIDRLNDELGRYTFLTKIY